MSIGTSASESLAVLQVVPRMRGQLDGVADYARALGTAIQSGGHTQVSYLSGDPGDDPAGNRDAGPVALLGARSNASLVSELGRFSSGEGARAILLHYVNYGYASRGCPLWLVHGFSEWKRAFPRARMVVMFHELYASGPPWRSSFWLSPVQRSLARRLYAISDAVVTNREASRHWLARGQAGGARVLPVFSSLGEPGSLVPWPGRSARMVIAGRSGAPDRAYGRHRESLLMACEVLGVEEIVDIGARDAPVPARIGRVPVTALGHLAPAQACEVLAGARAGFIDYPSDFLAKSTVFAAYAAHGLVPVVSWRRGEEEAGLTEGVNYWVPHRLPGAVPDFESIAKGAGDWYAGHGLEVQAQEFRSLLRGLGH